MFVLQVGCQVEVKLERARWLDCQVGQVASATWRLEFCHLATWPTWARWLPNGQSDFGRFRRFLNFFWIFGPGVRDENFARRPSMLTF